MKKRSNAPIFWALFGAGGMLSALTGPMLVFIVGIAVPAGFLLSPQTMSYQRMLPFVQHPVGKAIVFVLIMLYVWHAAHRIFKSLHDVGIHPGMAAKLACYGTALAATLVAAYGALAVGW